jgi:hypothetical protein
MLNRSSGSVSALIQGAADGSLANRWFIFLHGIKIALLSNGHKRKLEKQASLISLITLRNDVVLACLSAQWGRVGVCLFLFDLSAANISRTIQVQSSCNLSLRQGDN